MKHPRVWTILATLALIAVAVFFVLPRAGAAGAPAFSGGAYLTTIKDSGGNLASRSVITLHTDRTMIAVDSAEQGPNDYFGSQMGTWRVEGSHRIAGRTINFRFPQSPDPGIARSEYVIDFSPDRRHVTGTITVYAYPLQGVDPLEDPGTLLGTFCFEGEWIKP